ncbi:hypothetical protein K7X08_015247 [Anisodus acutangulus]|uniref:Uncharacterized protein n=1 Tax=Anisodus acutangulus TaxID=402998 RepID=A0A9Q1L332_9SOLA|nr:hypothetical protein K7X08_015247 [Anisodus acutangulus]
MFGGTMMDQMYKPFKLCSSLYEKYWRKSKLSHATSSGIDAMKTGPFERKLSALYFLIGILTNKKYVMAMYQGEHLAKIKEGIRRLLFEPTAFHQPRALEKQLLSITIVMQRSNSNHDHRLQFIIQSTVKDSKYSESKELFLKMLESKIYELISDEVRSNINILTDMKLEKFCSSFVVEQR